MSLDIGFDAQTPSLPNAAGAVGGLGQTFSPDLSTGSATLTIPLDLPNGPNDIGPKLFFRFDSSAPNGPFGLGFALPLPRLVRSTAQSYPAYDASDVLMLEGAGPLVAPGGGAYRPQVDDGSWRITVAGEGFVATDKAGRRYFLGESAAGRLVDDDASAAPRVFAWHLERIEDALGNEAKFTWIRDGRQLYLSRIDYGVYSVQFSYTTRPDLLRTGRAGFLVLTALRCESVELRIPTDAQPLLRRWSIMYEQDQGNGASLLTSVVMTGFDEAGNSLATPALTLGYSAAAAPTLTRCSSEEGAAPGLISRVDHRVELLDWNGDGLPDLLEVSPGGVARVWPNLGDCRWGAPHSAGSLPLLAQPTAAVAFADMDGDGQADLLRVDGPLGRYMPRLPGGGFGEPVAWSHAPAPPPMAPWTRLVDLNGDGIPDLLASGRDGRTFVAFYRTSDGAGGWQPMPEVVAAPPEAENLADPHVFIADMTGDGSSDLVRVDGGGVIYWPYLGNGRWDKPVTMAAPPTLPFNARADRLFLIDLDGDGASDLVYLDGNRLTYWLNRCGNGFGPPVTLEPVPTGQFGEFRFADMTGSGTNGLLWSARGPCGRSTAHFYLDPMGGSRPSQLIRSDNGIGQITTIGYSTSAREASLDAAQGRVWPGILPMVVPVVASIDTADSATGQKSAVRLRYHDGRYDGILREFAGFGEVEQRDLGDATIGTLHTISYFATGLDPASDAEPQTADARLRWRAIRGRILRQERFGEDGSLFDRQESKWTVTSDTTPGGPVYIPRLAASVRTVFDRAPSAAAVTTTTQDAWDVYGNVTSTTQTVDALDGASPVRTLRTFAQYAADPADRFRALPWRVQQFDGATLVADTITEYDHAAEGQVGAQGLVTRRSSLILTDALVAGVYGSAPPDFAALGYYRRPGESGWWADQARYQRTEDAAGLSGKVVNARGGVTSLVFDASKTCPVRITDAAGNTVSATPDLRLSRVMGLTSPDGLSHNAGYDALARIIAEVEPGDTAAQPTVSYDYVTSRTPVESVTRRRTVSGQAQTIDTRELYDGSGRLVERRVRDKRGEIVLLSQLYNSRGLAAAIWQEYRPPAGLYAQPDPTLPHIAVTYDELGRVVSRRNRDGSVRTFKYHPLWVEEADEEDTRAGGPHANTPTRRIFSAAGELSAVEQNLAGRILRSRYDYDIKGNLISHTDALGNVTRFDHDLAGRKLRVVKPESVTVHVYDAVGNLTQIHPQGGESTYLVFDMGNRPISLHYGTPDTPPQTQWTYHDAGSPAPPDAGAHTPGRCVRIDDAGGSTVFDYDAVGRMAMKRIRPVGLVQDYRVDISYRADGQPATITYPDAGSGRLVQPFEYDERGNVLRVPGVVKSVAYDLGGRRTQIAYGNDVVQDLAYDPTSFRLTGMTLSGPQGVIRATTLTTDLVGNVTGVESPDAAIARAYIYDDLYRLTSAAGGGHNWSYSYDDASNLTQTSALGSFRYGENGFSATCLTSAGTEKFTYTPQGQIAETPWGTHSYDAGGRLAAITHGAEAVNFVYDFAGNCVASRSIGAVSPPVNRLTPDKLFSIENGSLILNLFDGAGMVARRNAAGVAVWLHADHLGSLTVVTDGAGAVVETRDYDPYGASLDGVVPSEPFGYAGGEPNFWSGLTNLGARFYQPALGRFITPDPVVQDTGLPVAWSSYVYCRGNPTSYADLGGLSFWGAVGGFLGGVAGAIGGFLIGGPVGAVAGAIAGAAAGAALGGDSGLAQTVGGVLTDPRFWECVAAVAALTALTALSIVTFGATAGLLVVGIGVLAGGLVGGIATAQQKGATGWDIVTGALVGAAVGGWAAFGAIFAGPAVGSWVSGALGQSVGSVVSGAVNGAIAGAATGFTSGFAGGKGQWDWGKFLWTVAMGAIVGGIFAGMGIGNIVKSGENFGNLGYQAPFRVAGSLEEMAVKFSVDPMQSFFQATATVLGTLAKNSLPPSPFEGAYAKGWLKFGFGIIEYGAETSSW